MPRKKFESLDEKTILFMKSWGKKWKAKSMFQVLLLYRAQRLQDLTYFCQQVHIYNHNAAGVLMGASKKTVSLEKIKQGGSVFDFLGPPAQPSINKVPFRYHDFMKFDPMEPKGSAFGDDEPWDEPLKRGRHQGPKDKHFAYKYRDQEVQTANLESFEVTQTLDELAHKDCPEELNFIDTPYTRDPQNIREMYSDQQYRNKYNTPKKARAPSPPRPKSRTKVPVNSYADINEDIQNESYFYQDSRRGQTPPARDPPPPPARHSDRQSDYDRNAGYQRSADQMSKTNNNNNYSHKTSQPTKYTPKGLPAREHNPVHELQMLAQQANTNDSEDDPPPFNFQAMLRKTNVTRESLRRVRRNNTGEDNRNGNNVFINGTTTTYNPVDARNKHSNMNGFSGTQDISEHHDRSNRNANQRNSNETNNFGRTNQNQTNGSSRNYSEMNNYGRTNQNETNSYSRNNETNNNRIDQNSRHDFRRNNSNQDYQRTNSNDYLNQSRNNLNRTQNGYGDRITRTELAPGIIVEGYEVDL